MIYNSELHRKVIELIREIKRIDFEYGGKIHQNSIDKMEINLVVNYSIELCEKQKGKKDNICDSKIKL